jgi:hypothetical protein
MSRWHIVVKNNDGTVVGQFDVSSKHRRAKIYDNIPDALSASERAIPDDMSVDKSLTQLSEQSVEWDERISSL